MSRPPKAKLPDTTSTELDGEEVDEDDLLVLKDVTVKFRILKSQIVTHAYPNIYTIEEVKKDISKKFQIQPQFLILKQSSSERILEDVLRLFDVCDNNYGIVNMDLELAESAREENIRLEPQVYYKYAPVSIINANNVQELLITIVPVFQQFQSTGYNYGPHST